MARVTRQRDAVRAIFSRLDGFHSIQDVHARLRDGGDAVGLTTVYRAVQSLAEDGELDSIRTDSSEALYRRCSTEHHHHLVCRACGRTVEVAGPAVERRARRVAEEHGFVDTSPTVEVFCTCKDGHRASPGDGGREVRPRGGD
ncbi:MAG TPA: transcriptional repressor [Nocardioidaceae bacterium]|nr:transcriptional repressor [Nocardioidaceae bacterium]